MDKGSFTPSAEMAPTRPRGPRPKKGAVAGSYCKGGESRNMSNLTERRLGYGFGLLGGGLILLGSFVSLLVGVADLALRHPYGAVTSVSLAAVLFVVGGLALFFTWLARHDWENRPMVGGIMMVVIAAVGWAFLGLGANVVSVVGALFVLLGGVLFLAGPAERAVTSVVAPA